jgi:hypothetical protein
VVSPGEVLEAVDGGVRLFAFAAAIGVFGAQQQFQNLGEPLFEAKSNTVAMTAGKLGNVIQSPHEQIVSLVNHDQFEFDLRHHNLTRHSRNFLTPTNSMFEVRSPHPARLDGANDGVLLEQQASCESDPIRLVRMVKKIVGPRWSRQLVHHPDELDGVRKVALFQS